MTKPKPKPRSVRFIIRLTIPAERRLWDHLQVLAEAGDASTWIRSTLIAALPPEPPKEEAPDATLR
jgi:hypothetical protein